MALSHTSVCRGELRVLLKQGVNPPKWVNTLKPFLYESLTVGQIAVSARSAIVV